MDAIQAVSSKTNPQAANPAAANDDASVAGIFATLLSAIGNTFKPDNGSLGMDTKLMRGNDDADTRDARDAAKVRDDKHDDRAAKSKESKSRDDQDDGAADETDAAASDDNTQDTDTAAQAPQEQAAAPVAVVVPMDVPLVTSEILAPVLIAQQVTEAATVQQTAVQATVAVTDPAAVATDAAKTVVADAGAAVKEAAVVEAPAAVQKTAAAAVQVKQVAAAVTGPAEAAVSDVAAESTVVAKDAGADKGKDSAQVATTTQRSAAAQAQSQDLSQKVGPETKAAVQVNVTNHSGPQTAVVNSVYDIYSGYSNTQSSTANGQAGVADAGNALVQNTKTPAEAAQAQISSPSPVFAPQPQSPSPQQGPSSSLMRADFSAPSTPQTGGSQASFGEASFGNAGSSSQSNATSSTSQAAPAERPLPPAQQIIDQIKVNITRAAKAGLDKVTIQLKPHELGRVDVQLEMSEDHKVRVTVTADNKDTLALLQNDSRTLENALKDAGLRTDANNLHFSLRSDAEARDAENGRGSKGGKGDNNGATDDADDIAMTYDYAEIARARGGIDTFA